MVTTVAGSLSGTSGFTNGVGTNALLDVQEGIAVDSNGFIFFAEYSDPRIRKISPNCQLGYVLSGTACVATPAGKYLFVW